MSTATVVSEPNIGLLFASGIQSTWSIPSTSSTTFLHRTIFSISAATTKHHLSTAVPSS